MKVDSKGIQIVIPTEGKVPVEKVLDTKFSVGLRFEDNYIIFDKVIYGENCSFTASIHKDERLQSYHIYLINNEKKIGNQLIKKTFWLNVEEYSSGTFYVYYCYASQDFVQYLGECTKK